MVSKGSVLAKDKAGRRQLAYVKLWFCRIESKLAKVNPEKGEGIQLNLEILNMN